MTRRIINLIAVVSGMFILCCAGKEDMRPKSISRDIHAVKEAHTPELMGIGGVQGVYIGQTSDGTPCIVVMVAERTPAVLKRIPSVLEGYAVRVEETGILRPMK